jgi:hypothetical protein
VFRLQVLATLLLMGLAGGKAWAAVTVLLSEPFGRFGTMMPVGHAGVYLDKVCADTPVHLRKCRLGEMGVVLSRYHKVQEIDWLAIPVMPFLYGVERPEDVPQFMTLEREAEIREEYRKEHLAEIVPGGKDGKPAKKGEWVETIGVAFDRRVWGYRLETTAEQDERLIETLNARPNVRSYKLRTANCANFAADMVNILFPGTVQVRKLADFGLMTPKQVVRSVVAYSRTHPETRMRVVEVAQIAGTLRRSRPAWGVAEAGLKTKRYLATLLMIQPEVVLGCGIAYLGNGRWHVGEGAEKVGPEAWATRGGGEMAEADAGDGNGAAGEHTLR